ncbi:hypothetical protein BCR36DRAFT_354705 [Piromyces finnis]|uniref:Uncharacterized protein n=1 Tax=Piromyces finnis TaxID=1754191 RepID=A0A1Y1V7F4_9FUNG|nr:hypothetical protein BCR36DRAFT_354705 [Piromyces finnis]|eukprot:ORX48397.1 hypothetical protein BCR36DRAFT_354705 [Piromyces finnis]
MYYIYKYKEHPYIKVVSPLFCNIVVFGCILNIISIVIRLPPYFILKARLFIVFTTIKYCCIYIPMFIITYRIYRIFNSKLVISKSLSNKRLLLLFFGIFLATTIYRTIIAFIDNVYYMSYGDILTARFPMYEYNAYDYDHYVYEYYLHGISYLLIFFIIIVGKNSRKFGDISYIYLVFVINVLDYTLEELLIYLSSDHYGRNFVLITLINCVVTLICIYMLVGCRIIFVMISPSLTNANSEDLKEFIPLKLTKMGYTKIVEKMNSIKSSSKNVNSNECQIEKTNTYISNSTSIDTKNSNTCN